MKPENPMLHERLPYLKEAQVALANAIKVWATATLTDHDIFHIPPEGCDKIIREQLCTSMAWEMSKRMERNEGIRFPTPKEIPGQLVMEYTVETRLISERHYSFLCSIIGTLIRDAEELLP